MRAFVLLAAALLLLLSPTATAQSISCSVCPYAVSPDPATSDWYVDPVGGLDQDPNVIPGAGSKSLPFFRLSWAVCYADDNDRIHLLPGVYSPTLNGETFPVRFGNTCSMLNIQVIGVAGAESTILDGEFTVVDANGILRFQAMAQGARLSGVTVQNYAGTLGAIRLGSTSGGNFLALDVEIERCVIRQTDPGSGIATFGTSNGLKIHDNLVIGNNDNGLWLSDIVSSAMGPLNGEVYNNTIVDNGGPTMSPGGNGIRIQGGSWVITNNILANNNVFGIYYFGLNDPTSTVLFENYGGTNNAFFNNLGGDYGGNPGIVLPPSLPFSNDILGDPLFVSPDPNALPSVVAQGYELQGTSPLIEAASAAIPLYSETDYAGDPRILDGNGDLATAPDVGFDEVSTYSFVLQSGAIKQGTTATFALAGPVGGLGNLFLSCTTANLPLPICGNVLLNVVDPCFANFGTIVAGGPPLAVPIPVNPILVGLFVHTQAVVLQITGPMVTGCHTTNRLDNQL